MWKNNQNWIVLSFLSICSSIFAYTIKPNLGIKVSVYLGLFFLVFTLLPSNLISIAGGNLKKTMVKLFGLRRDLGITSGLLFATHGLMSGNYFGKFQFSFYLRAEIIFGFIALLIFYALLLTSSKWARRSMKSYWNWLHKLVWVAVGLGIVHSVLAKANYENELPILAFLGFGSIFFVALIQVFQNKWLHLALIAIGVIFAGGILALAYPETFSEPLIYQEQTSEENLSSSSQSSIEASKTSSSNSVSSNSTSSISSSLISTSESSSTSQSSSSLASISSSSSTKSSGITTAELAKNKTSSSCWLAYKKKVYNATGYLNDHPGGRRAILDYCGKEIDSFSSQHPGGNFSGLISTLNPFFIGNLV